MLMNTNPKNEELPYGVKEAWQITYFHECMSGFEHQVAAHMMAEGMTDEALLLTKAIHDRYHAVKRNPFNEVECSDHYARAMASYGTYITACGFEYHGPKGYIRFAPKINSTNFNAAFTAAEGWGNYLQRKSKNRWTYQLDLKHGKLAVKTISLQCDLKKVMKVSITINEQKIESKTKQEDNNVVIDFPNPVTISEKQTLKITLT